MSSSSKHQQTLMPTPPSSGQASAIATPNLISKTPQADREFKEMAEAAARKNVERETFGYGLHSLALQIKDPERSRWFYTTVLGMEVVRETEIGDVNMMFLAFPNPPDCEDPDLEFGQRRGLIQLVHVAGSENQSNFRVNVVTPGFCHTCVSVPDLEQAVERCRRLGVSILEEGSNELGYGAIADPDGYPIQLLHCQIDQSVALRRHLEEMMSTTNASSTGGSPSTSSNRRPSVFSSHKDMSLDDLTRSISISSSAAVNGFRGGSPNLEHPHWLQMSSTNGSSGPEAQASSSRAEASSSAPLPSPGLAEDRKGKGKGSASSPAAQPAAGSSSSPFSSPGPSGLPAHVTAPSKKHRSPSHGSIVRPGAPTSINLSDLTSGKASFGGQSRAHRPRKSQSSILVAASEGEQGAGSTSKGAARNKPPSYEHATGLPNGHGSSSGGGSDGGGGLGDVTRTDTRSAVPTPETSPQPSRRTSTTSPSGHARQNGSSSSSQGKANSRLQHHSPALSSSSPTPQVHQGKIRPDHTTSSSSSSSSSFPSLAALTGNAGGSALRNFRMRFGRSSGSKRVNDADEDGASGSGSAYTHAGDGDKKDEKERKGTM